MNFTELLADIRAAGIGEPEVERFAVTVTRRFDGYNKVQTFKSTAISCVSAIDEALRAMGIAEDDCGHVFIGVRPIK